MAADSEEAKWLGVLGRCLAYLCLKNSAYSEKGVSEQAAFLEKLGLDVDDQAAIVGSTAESLRVMMSRARSKRKARRGGKVKGKR